MTFAGGGTSESDSGTYSVSGNTITFASTGGATDSATISADGRTVTISETDAGTTVSVVFAKA